MLVADLPPVPAQETPIVWVQTVPRFGEDGARLEGVRNEATCGAMPVGYCALRVLGIGGMSSNNLLADGLLASRSDPITFPTVLQQPDVQGLLDYTQSFFETGDELMFAVEIPYVPLPETPMVLTQAATPPASQTPLTQTVAGPKVDYILKDCQEFSNHMAENSAEHIVNPAQLLQNYYIDHYHREIDLVSIRTSVLESAKHGEITPGVSTEGHLSYSYDPKPGFLGEDKVVFQAEFGGKRYKIVMKLLVRLSSDPQDSICPVPRLIKVSSQSGSDVLGNIGTVTFSISPLDGSIVGETTGQSITLDDNAAGHNWFIDATPADNSEFLPTSNPNQWIAKEGTEAAGKMDLLSVLLHEYGHALGIEHSADGNDFMAATLQPGVRRLPSSDELALMAQLVGEIKPALGLSNGAAPGNTPDTPLNPSLPVGTTLSALLLGRLRRTGYGSWSPLFDSAQVPAPVPQFAIAANAKLENPVFDGGTGWSTEGAVAFANSPSSGLGTGAATLTETAASQTRLNQVFVLGEHDRFLSFTLANVALGDQAGPDDAFEVALLDANTGLSLLGGTGLSHNDAFLNLQANGLEHKASGITRIDNADGSRTYLVDLAGIAAGTTVNLAFDLIGFGQGAARVGRNNQRALRRTKNLPILAPCLIIDAPGTRAAQKPPSVI